jgi:hypothetical protein
MEGFEAHHRLGDFLNEAMILLDPIIQIFDLEYFNQTQQACQHQQAIHILQANIVSAAFIHDDFHWQSVRVNGLFEESGSRLFISMLGKHKVNGIAVFIDSPVSVNPFPFDFDIGFIQVP